MKALCIVVLFTLLSLRAAALQQTAQQTTGASLEGIAINGRTNEPVRNVSVELRNLSGERLPIPAALSAEDGRFVFPSLPPGKYRLVGIRAGYVRSEFGQRFYGGPTQELTLVSGQKTAGIRLVMTQGGVISGRFTSDGQPAGAADVYAVTASNMDRRIDVRMVLSTKTNDLGEFSVFWLPPGSYYIVGIIPPAGVGTNSIVMNPDGNDRNALYEVGGLDRLRPGAGSADDPMHVPTYFPSTPDIRAARLIEVGPGAEIRNVNINSRSQPVYRVRGKFMVDAPLGPQARVSLDSPNTNYGADGNEIPLLTNANSRFAVPARDGSFEIERVTPGSYVLSLVPTYFGAVTGSMPLEVRGNIDNLLVPPVRTVRPSANVTIEGANPADPQSLRLYLRVSLELKPVASNSRLTPSHALNRTADGSYRTRDADPAVPPGDYSVFVYPLLTPPSSSPPVLGTATAAFQKMYVKSIRLGNVDIQRDGLRLQSDLADPITVVLGMNPGAVEGRVLNQKQAPVPAVWVALVPEEGRRFRRNHEFTSTDATGRFHLDNVPPGNYRLLAGQEIQRGEWEDATFLRRFEDLGTPVRVEEGRKTTVDATAIPPR